MNAFAPASALASRQWPKEIGPGDHAKIRNSGGADAGPASLGVRIDIAAQAASVPSATRVASGSADRSREAVWGDVVRALCGKRRESPLPPAWQRRRTTPPRPLESLRAGSYPTFQDLLVPS